MDTWRAAYRGIVPDAHLDGLSYGESERLWQDTIMAGDGCVFVAEDEDGVFGFVSGGPRERFSQGLGEYEGELQTVYVLPSTRAPARADVSCGRSPDTSRTTAWTPCSCGCLRRTAPRGPACRFYKSLGGAPVQEDGFELGGVWLSGTAYGWKDLDALFVGGSGGR